MRSSEYELISIASSFSSSLKRAAYEVDWYINNGVRILEWLERRNKTADPEYRLPTFVKPEHYEVYLRQFFEDKNFTYEGKIIINIKVLNDTGKIVLNSKDLNIEKVDVSDGLKKTNNITNTSYCEEAEQLTIYFKNVIRAGTKFMLKIKYQGQLRKDITGYYRSLYKDENGNLK